jgi:hypothetical protein
MSKKLMFIAVLCIMAMAVTAYGADKLIVKNGSSQNVFTASDTGTIMLNTATWDAPAWAKIYGSTDASITGFSLDSYGNSNVMGGGGNFRFARGTQASKATVVNGDRLGFFVFSAYDGSAFYNSAAFAAKIDGAVSAGVVPTKLTFETGTNSSRTERMVITSSGNVGIGISAPTRPLEFASGAYVTAGGVFTSVSTRESKENIAELSASAAAETLKSLNPVTYNYKVDKNEHHVGFIAEDVPELVATKERKGLSPMDIVAVLTKVVKEQDKTIESLSTTVARLEAKLNELESKDMSAQK